jgi:hypothetical protein
VVRVDPTPLGSAQRNYGKAMSYVAPSHSRTRAGGSQLGGEWVRGPGRGSSLMCAPCHVLCGNALACCRYADPKLVGGQGLCGSQFTALSGLVACRQAGYDKGMGGSSWLRDEVNGTAKRIPLGAMCTGAGASWPWFISLLQVLSIHIAAATPLLWASP